MNKKKYRAALSLALAALCAAYAHAAPPKMQVAGFEDSLTLQVGTQFIQLTEGSLGFTVKENVNATLLSGKAYLVVGQTAIQAEAGDSFIYQTSGMHAQIQVQSGKLTITLPRKAAVTLHAGEALTLPGTDADAVSIPADSASRIPVTAPPAPPRPQTPTAEDHPLAMIGDAFHRMARIRPAELKFIIELHPYYMATQTYDSNIYLVPKDKGDGTVVGGGVVGSWITQNSFGSKVALPINRRQSLNAFYDINVLNYSHQSSINNTLNQRVRAHYRYNPKRGLELNLNESYTNTEDPAFSELVARQRRFENKMSASFDNRRSRLFVYGFQIGVTHHKYLDQTVSSLLNRFESSAGGRFGIKLRSRTTLFADYAREIIHYSAGRQNHSKSHKLGIGLTGRIAPKWTGEIHSSAQLRHYDQPTTGQPRNTTTILSNIELAYAFSKRTAVKTKIFRNIEETTFSNNRFYIGTGANLSMSHAFRKLSMTLDGSFETARYPESSTVSGQSANRRDDIYAGGVGARYKLKKWMSAGMKYQRLQRHSNFSGSYNYKANRTSLNIRIEF